VGQQGQKRSGSNERAHVPEDGYCNNVGCGNYEGDLLRVVEGESSIPWPEHVLGRSKLLG
jgi:hypothetical protein